MIFATLSIDQCSEIRRILLTPASGNLLSSLLINASAIDRAIIIPLHCNMKQRFSGGADAPKAKPSSTGREQ
jgi:hypothetical protein